MKVTRVAEIPDSPVVYASDILIAILVNLKKSCNTRQLFLKAGSYDFQKIFWEILQNPQFEYLRKMTFVYSDSGPEPFCPILQESIEHLQLSGMLNWPDLNEPEIMRINPSAEEYYTQESLGVGNKRTTLQDVIASKQIAKLLKGRWSQLIVERPYLVNC